MMAADAVPARTDVVVVGGGPVGLTAAGLLARDAVCSVVLERRTDTVRAPAAHVLRDVPRAVLGLLGVDDEIERAIPALEMNFITWCSTLGGTELGRLDIRSNDVSVRPWTNLSQNRLEPILRRAVETRPESTVVLGAQVTGITQTETTATVVVQMTDGSTAMIEADWVVAADGAGSRTRDALGIAMTGAGALGRFFMVHFRADLSPWVTHRSGPIFWIANPQAAGTLIVHDVTRSHVFMSSVVGTEGEEAAVPARLAAALGIPIEVDIVSIDTWTLNCQVAERYRDRRVFLVGDAAHRFPPSGGLGLNTGILEAHNLAAKIAAVHHGCAAEHTLDGYESECRPVAEANANESLDNALRLSLVSDVIGPCSDLAALEARLARLSSDEREALADAIAQQRSHFMSNGAFPVSAREVLAPKGRVAR